MHSLISQAFFCSAEDLREYRNNGRELEANTFAAELLIPKRMIDRKLLTQEPNWSIIQQFVSQFNVTPITAAVRYAELAHQPVIAVFSDGRNVRWWRENRPRTMGRAVAGVETSVVDGFNLLSLDVRAESSANP